MTKKDIMEAVRTIVGELTPLTSEERQRAVQASLALLGEVAAPKAPPTLLSESEQDEGDPGTVPVRARTWMKQNKLSLEQLHQVFHLGDGGVEVIAPEIPGKSKREKVRNAYVLAGTAQLVASGEAKFDDRAARALCEASGFYDHTNHMKYMKGGNEFTGSKDKGWTLTAPGLRRAALLVSELSDGS